MALQKEDKKVIVAQVAEVAANSISAIAADYRGLTVQEMTELRRQARNANVHLQVIRNTLARRALENTEFACMKSALVGPLILAFSKKEPSAAARVLRDFCKKHENLQVKAISIGGSLLDGSELEFVAKLPTREEAIATLLMTMKASVTQLVRTIAEPHTQLVRVISAVSQKEQQS